LFSDAPNPCPPSAIPIQNNNNKRLGTV
jgi:hypothetical protein